MTLSKRTIRTFQFKVNKLKTIRKVEPRILQFSFKIILVRSSKKCILLMEKSI